MKTTVLIKNTSVDSITVRLEPWGEEQEVAPGGEMNCQLTSNSPPVMEIQVGERGIIVYGWVGAVLE
jgi:hypothetical protein